MYKVEIYVSVFLCMLIMLMKLGNYLCSFLHAQKVEVCLQIVSVVFCSLSPAPHASFCAHFIIEEFFIDEVTKLCMIRWPFPFFDLLMNYLLMGCEIVVPSSCIVHHQT